MGDCMQREHACKRWAMHTCPPEPEQLGSHSAIVAREAGPACVLLCVKSTSHTLTTRPAPALLGRRIKLGM